jgi:hypothetical protein
MKKGSMSRSTLVGLAFFAVLALSLSVGSQQRVQTTTQLSVRTPVAVTDALAAWEKQYAEAMDVAEGLIRSGRANHGRRLANDLEALDGALREYVRVSERLRHKNRAFADTTQFLASQNAIQMESRKFQTLSNVSKVAHDVEHSTVRKMR